jgi:hypothetical protein
MQYQKKEIGKLALVFKNRVRNVGFTELGYAQGSRAWRASSLKSSLDARFRGNDRWIA